MVVVPRMVVMAWAMSALTPQACSDDPLPAVSNTDSASPSSFIESFPTPSPTEQLEGDPRVVRAAVRTVRAYLRDWVELGPAASSRYLASGPWTSDNGPRVNSARLTSAEVYRVDGPFSVVLYVSMDLDFANNPLAWNQGDNGRFVTATRTGDRGRYLLEFATGP